MAEPGQGDHAAIFSPSVARIAASAAKNWSYVDSWLLSRFPQGQKIPQFERNSATLKALLAIASVNEDVSNSHALIDRASKAALHELRDSEGVEGLVDNSSNHERTSILREAILSRTASFLSQEGRTALKALAVTAVRHGMGFPNPEDLAYEFLDLQISLLQTEHMIVRVGFLNEHLHHEMIKSNRLLSILQSHDYKLPSGLPKQNLELQRTTRARAVQLSDAREHQNSRPLRRSSHPTVQSVMKQEQHLLALIEEKKKMDTKISVFELLPSDPERAREQIEALQQQLMHFTTRRDQVFEGLIEQASPVKRRGA
ncbi:hypothetical protein QQS21_001877 [Conoideocrella luteorostrata]|uniref:HAUS augmin-like complex subunit 1 n=1 Tax=Conoideocrella luteorostrata TaxID=1105319 RepID=A0AAJ0FX45_9HYPO|nr:hypothetical protein QQS21_001877 [Conoideocrella luteorostrata]